MTTNKAYVVIESVGAVPLFGQSALNDSLWAYFNYGTPASSASVSDGDLLVAVGDTTSDVTDAGVWSNSTLDLTGGAAVAELAELGGATTAGGKTLVALAMQGAQEDPNLWGETIVFGVQEGGLYAWYCTGGGVGNRVQVFTASYDAANMKWLRIRESSGTLYFDTSPDGSTWTNQGNVADPFSVTSLYAVLMGVGWGSGVASTVGFSSFSAPGLAVSEPLTVGASAVVVASDNTIVVSPSVQAQFAYGVSGQSIRDAIEAAVRDAAGDSTLDVNFITG